MKKILIFVILSFLAIFMVFKDKDETGSNIPEPNTPEIDSNIPDPNIPEVDSTTSTYLNNITYTQNLESDIVTLIQEYFDSYYKSIKELKEYDMTYLFSDKDQGLINQAAVSLVVEIRKLKPADLSLNSVSYDLDIKEVSKIDNKIKVTVLENTNLRFNFMKEIESKVYNVKNEFVITKINDKYMIEKYNKVKDFFVMITDKYKNTGQEELNRIKNEYLTIIKKDIEEDKKSYENYISGNVSTKVCDNPYNRDKALEYALKWVNKRNSEWSKFDANCQNFASQVLYVGGIPMDHYGSNDNFLQWKFYDASYNTKEVNKGYVYTWTSVTRFYKYAKNNTGYGLCATVDENIYLAEAGDIIQVGTNGPTRHTLVSIGPYKKDGKILDILVNSNTIDLENYPLSGYVYPYKSLIKIYGFND